MFRKAVIAGLIATITITFSGCTKTGVEKEKFIPANNMKVQTALTENLDGDKSQEKIVLYAKKNEQGIPIAWTVMVDGYEMVTLDSQDGCYTLADFKLQDVDGKDGPEVLIYRYCTGSSGAQGLNIFKPGKDGWSEIFKVSNDFSMGEDRFEIKYLGNYRVSFKDKETGLGHIIELEKSVYSECEAMLEDISTWVDPIAEYRIEDTDGNGVKEITTVQRVCGITHPDTIAILNTVYQLRSGVYQTDKVVLTNNVGQLLAETKL